MNHTMWAQWKDFRLGEDYDEPDVLEQLITEFVKQGVDEMTVHKLPYSNRESQKHVESDIKEMRKIFNKSSQRAIAIMLSGVKSNKYDAMDLIRGLSMGKVDTRHGVSEMLMVLWSKVENRFRKYLGGKKRR